MRKITLSLITILIGIFFLLNYSGCSSSLKTIQLSSNSKFDKNDTIMFYIIPTGDSFLDETYARVLSLDFMARGYKTINANSLLNGNSDVINVTNQKQIRDILIHKNYLLDADAYIVVQAKWDSALVLTYYKENKSTRWTRYQFKGKYVPTLKSSVSFYTRKSTEAIKSYTASDTTLVYLEPDNSKLFFTDAPWMVIAKQISREFADIPICSIFHESPAEIKFKVSFWVDSSYRKAFPNSWKDRINRRVVYANDILRQQFNIELDIAELVEWNSEFKSSLENSLNKLEANSGSYPQQFKIGLTVDKALRTNWGTKSKLGLAMLLGNYAAITDQPSFQSVAQWWNSIEEALTLVHEVGHLMGAVHVDDNTSIMYPSSGYLSYEFDKANSKIIETTKSKFFNVNQNERIQNYFMILNNLRASNSENTIGVLEPAAGAFSNLLLHNKMLPDDQKRFNSLIISLSPDSAFAFAVKGYLEFKTNRLRESKQSFNKSIELDSNFTEVKKYLSMIPDYIKIDQNNLLEPNVDDNASSVKKSTGVPSKKHKR